MQSSLVSLKVVVVVRVVVRMEIAVVAVVKSLSVEVIAMKSLTTKRLCFQG